MCTDHRQLLSHLSLSFLTLIYLLELLQQQHIVLVPFSLLPSLLYLTHSSPTRHKQSPLSFATLLFSSSSLPPLLTPWEVQRDLQRIKWYHWALQWNRHNHARVKMADQTNTVDGTISWKGLQRVQLWLCQPTVRGFVPTPQGVCLMTDLLNVCVCVCGRFCGVLTGHWGLLHGDRTCV